MPLMLRGDLFAPELQLLIGAGGGIYLVFLYEQLLPAELLPERGKFFFGQRHRGTSFLNIHG